MVKELKKRYIDTPKVSKNGQNWLYMIGDCNEVNHEV